MINKRTSILIIVAVIIILVAGYVFSTWNRNQGSNQVTNKATKEETLVLPTPNKEQLEKAKKNAERMKLNIKNPLQEEPKGEGIKGF